MSSISTWNARPYISTGCIKKTQPSFVAYKAQYTGGQNSTFSSITVRAKELKVSHPGVLDKVHSLDFLRHIEGKVNQNELLQHSYFDFRRLQGVLLLVHTFIMQKNIL